MPRSTSTIRIIPSCDPSSRAKTGAGASSTRWSSTFHDRPLASAAPVGVAGHLRHAAHVDAGGGQDSHGADAARESLVERAALRDAARADYLAGPVWQQHV